MTWPGMDVQTAYTQKDSEIPVKNTTLPATCMKNHSESSSFLHRNARDY